MPSALLNAVSPALQALDPDDRCLKRLEIILDLLNVGLDLLELEPAKETEQPQRPVGMDYQWG